MTDLLGRVRAALGVTGDETDRRARVDRRLSSPPHPPMARATEEADETERLDRLRQRLEGHHATTALLPARGGIPAAVAAWLAAQALPKTARIAPALSDLDWSPLGVETGAPRAEDRVGISEAAVGIAETGSLVLHADADNPLTLAFTPEFHIVALAAEAIVGPIEAAWAWQRQAFPDRPPQSLTLVSGPSRTADIEQTMYLGAHGPRRLHVVIYGAES